MPDQPKFAFYTPATSLSLLSYMYKSTFMEKYNLNTYIVHNDYCVVLSPQLSSFVYFIYGSATQSISFNF